MAPRSYAVPLVRSSASMRASTHPGRSHGLARWAREQGRPLAIDLFAGCGGMSLGLEQAGYAVLLAVDNDADAVRRYESNMPGAALERDLSDPDHIQRVIAMAKGLNGLAIDLVAGGPPCQPFSRAGRSKIRSLVESGVRPEKDERAELWQAFVEIVEGIMPDAVLMENVPDLGLADDFTLLRLIAARLERVGYEVDFRILEAARHGVPQHRQRLILMGRRDGRPFDWPAEQKRITLRDAIGDLPPLGRKLGDEEMPARPPRTRFQKRARAKLNGTRVVHDHITRPVRKDDLEAFRLMKPGTRYGDLPARLRRYRDDIFNDKYNRLDWEDLSRSITAHIAKDGYWYIHPEEPRTLSIREAARIQTFPDHFRFDGIRSHAFRQIGNAVPPALAEAVGCSLLKAGKSQPVPASRRASVRMARIRSRLLSWAARDARSAPWRHPGDPWAVLVGLILQDRSGARDLSVREFLEQFPKLERGVSTKIRREAASEGPARRSRLERLAHAAATLLATRKQWAAERWMSAAALGPHEEAMFRLLALGEDRILATAPSLRVVARITGRKLDEERRLSEGRMELARHVGLEDGPPRLNAAFHALGRVVCTTQAPTCRRCPLRRDCRSASR